MAGSFRVRAKLALVVVALTAYFLLVAALVGVAVYAVADAGERAAMAELLRSQAAFLVAAAVLGAGGLAALVSWFFRLYVLPLRRLAEETRLVAGTNSEHRLAVTRPAELGDLVAAVNELAGHCQTVEDTVETLVADARDDLAAERNRLATLMSELTLPVLVCNFEGRILLYNEAARDVLDGPDPSGSAADGYVGLGRSVFGLVDHSLIAHALDRIRAGSSSSPSATTTYGGRLLRVRVASVAGAEEESTGFVLTFEDLTRRAVAGERRDELVRTLTEGTRASLAAIRAAVETVLDHPDMAASTQRRFVEVIQDEAQRMSERVDRAAGDIAAQIGDPSLLEDVLDRDLLAALETRLVSDPGVAVSVAEPERDLWLTVDSNGIVGAVADLVRFVWHTRGVTAVRLVVRPHDAPGNRYAALDAWWQGQGLTPGELAEWTRKPGVHELIERHAAQSWCGQREDGAYVRLLLPRAEVPPPAPAVAKARSTKASASGLGEFYDFDLFHLTKEVSELDDRPLAELACTVFDTETTGLRPAEGDEIISIGAIRVLNRRLLRGETFERFVDPRRDIPDASYQIHGISTDVVRGKPVLEDVLPQFARFAEDTVLVGHEVGFDLQFLRRSEPHAGVSLGLPALDTMLLSALVHPEHGQHSLEAIAQRLGVSVVGRHTALGDAIVTGEIYVRLLDLLEQRGLRTLGQVSEAARRTSLARRSEGIYGKA